MSGELDDVLQRDLEGKVTWLVSTVNDIDNRVENIESNHLTHIEKEIGLLRKGILIIAGIGLTVLTGMNIL
jgi:tetrahydromethanopterin S-methyltransferase subunit G